MKKRNCPVCDSSDAEVIMRFTPELLSKVNQTYRLEKLREAVKGKEKLLTYSRCRRCNMIYCENIWEDMILRQVYETTIDHDRSKEKILSIKKRLSLINTWANILRILSLLGSDRINNLKIIDYGCGWGDFLDVVDGFGIIVLGYEEDTIKIQLPEKRGRRIARNIDELKTLAPIDVFIMNDVLEHLQNVECIFGLARELLKPNGLLVFSVMDYRARFLKKNIDRLKNNLPALTKNLNPVEHVNVYDYRSVMATLRMHGFKFIATKHVFYLTDNYLVKNSMFLINILNKIESLSTKFITGKELSIQVYALNQKG